MSYKSSSKAILANSVIAVKVFPLRINDITSFFLPKINVSSY